MIFLMYQHADLELLIVYLLVDYNIIYANQIDKKKEVTKYDFYNPENIYIITNDKYEGLSEFIRAPYKPIANDIRDKYSFENWIKYVLDISPHQPISLPKV